MDEFRHRSFAQVCRAESNVSPSSPRRTRRREEGLGQRERKKVQGGKRLTGKGGVAGRGVERVWHDAWACESSPTPSDQFLSPFRQFSILARNPSQKRYASRFEPSFGNYYYMIHAMLTIRQSSQSRMYHKMHVASCVNKREKENSRIWKANLIDLSFSQINGEICIILVLFVACALPRHYHVSWYTTAYMCNMCMYIMIEYYMITLMIQGK